MNYTIEPVTKYGQSVFLVAIMLDDIILQQSVFLSYQLAWTFAHKFINKDSLPTAA